jgi:hypothetical protein
MSNHEIAPEAWPDIVLYIVDAPLHNALQTEERIKLIRNAIPEGHPFVRQLPFIQSSYANELIQNCLRLNQEVLLQKPKSFYHGQNSLFLARNSTSKILKSVEYHNGLAMCVDTNGNTFLLKAKALTGELVQADSFIKNRLPFSYTASTNSILHFTILMKIELEIQC